MTPSNSGALSALRRHEDPGAGIFEEFLDRRIGPGGAFALLAGPLGERRERGFVICPTIGPEHGNLRRLEAFVARALAAAGFDVLRIRPDAAPEHARISVALRLAELEEAGAVLRERGARTVGLAGALFGATIAALTADRVGADALALVEPVVRGRQYARELVRRETIARLVADEEAQTAVPVRAEGADGPKQELERLGHTTIRGLVLTQEELDAVSDVNLLGAPIAFSGTSLILGISPTGTPAPGLTQLRERLASLDGDASLEGVTDPLYAPLGEYYYRDAGLLRIDTRLALDQTIAERVAAWASSTETTSLAA